MNSEIDSAELHALFVELSNETLTPEKHDRLASILEQSPQARQQWFVFCDVETGLRDWAVTEDERRVNDLPSRWTDRPAVPLRRIGLVAVAATLLVSITWAIWPNRPSVPRTDDGLTHAETRINDVAVLAHAVDAEWTDTEALSAGSTLPPRLIRLRSGAVLIRFFSGATVVLEGPVEFEILATNEARLLSGKVNAHVPPQAKGFTVKTSLGDIVDHGTDFGVNLADQWPHELHVFSGKVEVKSGSQSVGLQTGEAIRLGADDPEVFDADRSAFLVEEELVRQSRLASVRRLARWRDASSTLSSDSSTLFHLQLDGDVTADRRRALANSAVGPNLGSDGSLVGGQWVTGRWHQKSGVLFGGPGDRIRLTIPRPMKFVTLLAWANVQSLPRWQNSLLSSDSEVPGSIQWQLTKRGQLRLAISRDLGRPQADWEAVESEPFLSEEQQRRWMLLATTFDGTTIRHYANGRLVGAGASFTPRSLHIGTAEIGNWIGDTRRELHAIVDEFVVLERVLSEGEIAEIHGYGKP